MKNPLAEKIDQIKRLAGINAREVAQLLDTTPETISRWVNGEVNPLRDRLQRVLNLEYFLSKLGEFYSPQETRLWLFSPHKLLDGGSPADRIKDGDSDAVSALVDQIRSGAYV